MSCTVLYKVRDDDEAAEVEGDWKFAAMVLDRSAGVSLGSAGGQLGVSWWSAGGQLGVSWG